MSNTYRKRVKTGLHTEIDANAGNSEPRFRHGVWAYVNNAAKEELPPAIDELQLQKGMSLVSSNPFYQSVLIFLDLLFKSRIRTLTTSASHRPSLHSHPPTTSRYPS